ncbi:Rv3717 family N-acetylmuramoyl-L-alanine amidase [Mycobacterium sp. NPDC050441]|uniref:Rv3717 family N-acetylmuramoyl-L-alanine amidase n=1 Tax=Mycobacterium sp. NPDC050441 TaxID=3155403 RepID=UPI0033D17DFE
MTPVRLPVCVRVGASVVSSVVIAATASATVDAPHATAAPSNVAGMIVFLDPGHNGANDGSISRQVPTGRGGTKDCQASGTSTEDGFPEHTFTWDTTLRVRAILTQMGVRTAMSRGNDNALGPCVDERASMANALRPNAIVSIHADGGPANGRGFHVLYSSPPLNNVQAGPSVQFAKTMRDQLSASGIPPATYIGSGGLDARSDIAGLNLAQFPSILVECGNMKNPVDSSLMKTPDGQQKYAEAIARGVVAYLGTQAGSPAR